MNHTSFRLLRMLAASSLLVALIGLSIRGSVIVPLGISEYQNTSVMALPFLYARDPVLRSLIDSATKPPVPTTLPTVEAETSTPAATEAPEPVPDRVLFIGDSRVEGLKLFARMDNADYFCDVGLQVYSVLEKELEDQSFPKQTLQTLLSHRQYGQIFVCFGLNEAGYPEHSFRQRYGSLLETIRALQPRATIILHGILSVTEEKSSSAPYLSLQNLNQRNRVIAAFANGEKTLYVDANPCFTDENGYLLTSLTNDGYHPTVEGYRRWRDWIVEIAGIGERVYGIESVGDD